MESCGASIPPDASLPRRSSATIWISLPSSAPSSAPAVFVPCALPSSSSSGSSSSCANQQNDPQDAQCTLLLLLFNAGSQGGH